MREKTYLVLAEFLSLVQSSVYIYIYITCVFAHFLSCLCFCSFCFCVVCLLVCLLILFLFLLKALFRMSGLSVRRCCLWCITQTHKRISQEAFIDVQQLHAQENWRCSFASRPSDIYITGVGRGERERISTVSSRLIERDEQNTDQGVRFLCWLFSKCVDMLKPTHFEFYDLLLVEHCYKFILTYNF